MCELKKKVAFGIAGVSAALIAGWKLVQNESEAAFTASPSAPAAGSDRSADPAPQRPTGPDPASSGETVQSTPAESPPDSAVGEPDLPKGASRAELYEIAQDLKIKGRSKMSKAELRRAIEAEG